MTKKSHKIKKATCCKKLLHKSFNPTTLTQFYIFLMEWTHFREIILSNESKRERMALKRFWWIYCEFRLYSRLILLRLKQNRDEHYFFGKWRCWIAVWNMFYFTTFPEKDCRFFWKRFIFKFLKSRNYLIKFKWSLKVLIRALSSELLLFKLYCWSYVIVKFFFTDAFYNKKIFFWILTEI